MQRTELLNESTKYVLDAQRQEVLHTLIQSNKFVDLKAFVNEQFKGYNQNKLDKFWNSIVGGDRRNLSYYMLFCKCIANDFNEMYLFFRKNMLPVSKLAEPFPTINFNDALTEYAIKYNNYFIINDLLKNKLTEPKDRFIIKAMSEKNINEISVLTDLLPNNATENRILDELKAHYYDKQRLLDCYSPSKHTPINNIISFLKEAKKLRSNLHLFFAANSSNLNQDCIREITKKSIEALDNTPSLKSF